MSKAVKIYTKTGDRGTTSLFNSERRSKNDPSFEALGDVDELNAYLGLIRSYIPDNTQLPEIQSRLFDVGAHLATPRNSSNSIKLARTDFPDEHVTTLETWIDGMESELPALRNFILPGGKPTTALFHVARGAERHVVTLVDQGDVDEVVLRYLNRLSDYLFVAARYDNLRAGGEETPWIK